MGELPIVFEFWDFVPNNPFFGPVADVSTSNVPVCLGEPLFDKLDAEGRVTFA